MTVLTECLPFGLPALREKTEKPQQAATDAGETDRRAAAEETEGPAEALSPAYRRKLLKREAARVALCNQAEGGLHRRDGLNCPACRNRGFVYALTEEGDVVARPCECLRKRETLKKIRASGLEQVIGDYTFDRFTTPEAWQRELKERAMAFCRDADARWFYVGGQVGSGKTHLCTAICADCIEKGLDVRYMLWAEQSKRLKALVNDGRAYAQALNEYKQAPVLYIDDFLKVRQGAAPSDGDLNLAFELINARLLLPEAVTVISSEKTLSEAMDYDEATFSRIFQQCGRYQAAITHDRSRNYRLRER